ncbi:hypothetical protein [Campylobacter showae]|uniref:hypothetical protein n=1 Tax=Campylobacter showae TaxID=204 RepID=UPI0028D2B3F6|nr:hypothetical protein [Campylobacter showae]
MTEFKSVKFSREVYARIKFYVLLKAFAVPLCAKQKMRVKFRKAVAPKRPFTAKRHKFK